MSQISQKFRILCLRISAHQFSYISQHFLVSALARLVFHSDPRHTLLICALILCFILFPNNQSTYPSLFSLSNPILSGSPRFSFILLSDFGPIHNLCSSSLLNFYSVYSLYAYFSLIHILFNFVNPLTIPLIVNQFWVNQFPLNFISLTSTRTMSPIIFFFVVHNKGLHFFVFFNNFYFLT